MFRSSLHETGWSWVDIRTQELCERGGGLRLTFSIALFRVPNKPYGFCQRKTLWTTALWTKARKALWTEALWTKGLKHSGLKN